MTDYTEAFRQVVNAQQTGELIHMLVSVDHPDLPATLRLNNSVRNVESRSMVFLASFVEVTIIDQDPARSPQAQLAFSNIRREMVVGLQSTPVPCLVTIEVVRGSAPDIMERVISNLEMRNVEGDEMVLQGDLTPKRLRPRKAVDYSFTPTTAPGLYS
ncbi:MAG: hypothetical protein WC600_17215 [Desulfobaccales bacterium]